MQKEKKKNKKKTLPKLLESCVEDFSEQIKNRGTDYYERYNVLSCIKNKDDFVATVEGSDDNVYTVNIETEEGKVVYYDCTNYFFEIDNEDDIRKYGINFLFLKS